MRLYQYLNENKTLEDLLTLINTKCRPFLRDWNGKGFLWRGFQRAASGWEIRSPRKDRRPLDTTRDQHDFMNAMFYKKFGINLRSEALFCIGNRRANGYGALYMIFPIGDYEVYWSPFIRDLYQDVFNHETNKVHRNMGAEYDHPKHTEEINNIIRSYQKGYVNNAIESNNEIMLICKEYIMVDQIYDEFFKKMRHEGKL